MVFGLCAWEFGGLCLRGIMAVAAATVPGRRRRGQDAAATASILTARLSHRCERRLIALRSPGRQRSTRRTTSICCRRQLHRDSVGPGVNLKLAANNSSLNFHLGRVERPHPATHLDVHP
jgi:hypothetical protein